MRGTPNEPAMAAVLRPDTPSAPAVPRGASVLVATPGVRAPLMEALSRAGHRVARVGDADAAVERALAEDFDLLLLDADLAGIGAVAAADILRRLGRTVHLVRLVAGDGDGPPGEAGPGTWFDETLPADPDAATLAAVVARAVRASDAGFAARQAAALADAVDELRPEFDAGLPEALRGIAQAVEARDAESLRAACHRLRGSAALFGHEALAAAAARVERALGDGLRATAFAAAGEIVDGVHGGASA